MVGAGVTSSVGFNVSGGILRASHSMMSGKQIIPWGHSAVIVNDGISVEFVEHDTYN